MSSSWVHSVETGASLKTLSGKRCAASGFWLLALASACGSGVVDVGELPGDAGALGSSPDPSGDVGGQQSPQAAACAALGLEQYRLVFDSDAGKLERRIYSMRADGSELTPLTPADELAREPAVSPDGTQLAYATPEGIKVLDLATGQSELVLPEADQPNWSPDGLRLAFRQGVEPNTAIGMLRMSDRGVELGGGLSSSSAEFTLDSSTLVFADEAFRDGANVLTGIKAANWQTGVTRELVPSSSVRVTYPTLSPDGVWVAAAFQCAEQSSLWISPFAVTTPACEGRRVTLANAATATNPKWGPGVLVAYERSAPPRDISIVTADTGDDCVIERPGDDRNPSWVPDVFTSPQ